MAFSLSSGDVWMVRCYFWGFFRGVRYLLMRPQSYLGVGNGKHRKVCGLGSRTPQEIKILESGHETARAGLS